jgi:hypothetical protein
MFELSKIFESQTTTHAFIIISIGLIIFNVLLDTSLVLIRKPSHLRSLRRATQIQIVGALVIAAAFLAAGVGAGAHPLISHRKAAAIAAQTNTFSIEELHRQINTKAPPVRNINDPM